MPNLQVVANGNFDMRIDTDEITSFQSKYGWACPCSSVSIMVVPLGSNTGGFTPNQLVGHLAIVIDNAHNKHTYCVVGDEGPARYGWAEVSIKCARNLGYGPDKASDAYGPNSNWTYYVDLSDPPNWSRNQDMETQVQTFGQQRFGGSQLLNNTTATASIQNGTSYIASGQYINKDDINYDALNYVIATISRNTTSINYGQMKENNLAGVVIEAGYLYNSQHQEVYYRNPKLKDQATAAANNDVPFGWYCDAKARSIQEARKEIYQLSFIIRKYPPTLGVFVHFQLVKSKSVNDSIVEYYKNELVRLGLQDRIGIIANDSELATISWKETHYKDWILWWNKHVSDVSELDKLLTPSLFVV